MKFSRWIPLSILVLIVVGFVASPIGAQGNDGPGPVVFASDRTGNYEIYMLDPETGLTTQLTNDPAEDVDPMWSPDGSTIVFASDRDGDFELYVMRANGTDLRQLTNNTSEERQPRWQSDGLYIVFVSDVNGQWDLYTVSADGAIVRQLTNDAFDERGPGMEAGTDGVLSPGGTSPTVTPFSASPVPAQPDAIVIARQQLNVRTNPGEGAPLITSVPRDTPLDIVGRYYDNSWLQVMIPDGRVGWVYARLVQINIGLDTVPVVNVTFINPTPTATYTPTPPPVTATPVPVVISFGVDQTTITAGECVTLTWYVEGIKAVFYQGEGVVGAGSREECPTETTTYKLTVTKMDDTIEERSITVTVEEAEEEEEE